MTDKASSETRVTTRWAPNSTTSLPFLNQSEIDHNLKFLMSNWQKSAPMTAGVREAWLDVLCQLRVGELKPAISRRKDNVTHRPEPYAILDIVLAMRHEALRTVQREREAVVADHVQSIAREVPGKFDIYKIPEMVAARASLGKANQTTNQGEK